MRRDLVLFEGESVAVAQSTAVLQRGVPLVLLGEGLVDIEVSFCLNQAQ